MGSGKSGVNGGGGGKTVVLIEGKAVNLHNPDEDTNATEWEKGLTPAEEGAINAYSYSAYSGLNKNLREGNELTDSQKELQKNIDAAIAKGVIKNDIKLYRGSTADLVGGYKTVEDIKKNLVGKTIQDKGYMSTSISKNASFTSNPIYYKVTVPKGKGRGAYINNVSGYKNIEYEFLLKRGSNFLVTDATKMKSGKVVVHLQVVD